MGCKCDEEFGDYIFCPRHGENSEYYKKLVRNEILIKKAAAKLKNERNKVKIPHLIQDWFELTYAQYLTIPRSVLQSMSNLWQEKFVSLLEELDETIDWRPNGGRYWVRLKDITGRFVEDGFMDYERGRRIINHKIKAHSRLNDGENTHDYTIELVGHKEELIVERKVYDVSIDVKKKNKISANRKSGDK